MKLLERSTTHQTRRIAHKDVNKPTLRSWIQQQKNRGKKNEINLSLRHPIPGFSRARLFFFIYIYINLNGGRFDTSIRMFELILSAALFSARRIGLFCFPFPFHFGSVLKTWNKQTTCATCLRPPTPSSHHFESMAALSTLRQYRTGYHCRC